MPAPEVTEAEVVDVLIGAADPELKARVRRAMAEDPQVAAMARKWTETTRIVRRDTAPLRAMAERVRHRVMEGLPEARRAERREREGARLDGGRAWPEWLTAVRRFLPSARSAAVLALSVVLAVLVLSVVAVITFQLGSRYSKNLAHDTRLAPGRMPPGVGSEEGDGSDGGGERSVPLRNQWRDAWESAFVLGEAQVQVSALEGQGAPLKEGQVFPYPARLSVPDGGMACVTLSNASGVDITGPGVVELRHNREVYQASGEVRYRVGAPRAGESTFQVVTPHGAVEDLGTEFIVAIHDTHATWTRVLSGRVRVMPRLGLSAELTEGMEATLTEDRVALKPSDTDGSALAPDRTGRSCLQAAPGECVVMFFQPRTRLLRPGSALMEYIQPQSVCLTSRKPRIVSRAPSFTVETPEMTVIRMALDGQIVEVAMAVDFKLNDTMRIYIDRNLNGDLTDDPVYSEGEDFLRGEYFAAGLGRFDNVLWARRVVVSGGMPDGDDVQEKIEYVNRLYLLSDPILLPDPSGHPASHRLVVLDANSDGEFFPPDGALGVWLAGDGSDGAEPEIVGGPMRLDGSEIFMGFRWSLEDAAGQPRLVAERTGDAAGVENGRQRQQPVPLTYMERWGPGAALFSRFADITREHEALLRESLDNTSSSW